MSLANPPPLRIPAVVRRHLEALLRELLSVPGASIEDFATPAGEPALSAADSVSWRVFRNPVSVFIGGVAAVLLELAEPRVRTGVWEHTTFRERPLARMQRTAWAAMMTVYGPRSRAEGMIAAVTRRHAGVTGSTPAGVPYNALDDVLLTWVQATAQFGFLEASHRFVSPLTQVERDTFYAEGRPSARLYGVCAPPASEADVAALFEKMRPLLEPSAIVLEFLDIMNRLPALPSVARPLQRWLVKAAIECLPAWTRERLGLDAAAWSLSRWQRAIVRSLARGAGRLALATHPAVQASRRMGLREDALYGG
jgi:uncharacterized protein (DUF2236 family)